MGPDALNYHHADYVIYTRGVSQGKKQGVQGEEDGMIQRSFSLMGTSHAYLSEKGWQ